MAREGDVYYSPELAELICAELTEGKSLREVCRQDGMPSETAVRLWSLEDRNGFASQYAKARAVGYQRLADELLDIADDGSNDWMERNDGENQAFLVNGEALGRSRLRVDTRKWLLSKVLPKIYGDKLAIGGDADAPPIRTEEVGAGMRALTDLIAGIAAKNSSDEKPD